MEECRVRSSQYMQEDTLHLGTAVLGFEHRLPCYNFVVYESGLFLMNKFYITQLSLLTSLSLVRAKEKI
jgi:hypothetical protein